MVLSRPARTHVLPAPQNPDGLTIAPIRRSAESQSATAFMPDTGKVERLRRCRFVLTADADTRLPGGVVRRLVGTLAHPLNRAHFAPDTGIVERGYTILQPRVELAPEGPEHSLFARLYGGHTMIDIY